MSIPVLTRKLDALIDGYNQEIDSRTDYFNARSDKWQESEKGEVYSDITLALENARDELEEAKSEMEEIVEY